MVAWTWPLVRQLKDAVPGDPGDNYSFLWNLWWMRRVIATPGLAYFHTSYLFYPVGTTIADHPHTALPALVAATLLSPASIVTAQNLLLLAYAFANLTSMYALAWTILSATIDPAAFAPEALRRASPKRESLDAEQAPLRDFHELCVVRRGHRRAAMLAAVLFGLSPYLAVHLLGHFDLVAAWVLPVFALALRRAVHGGSNAAAAAAGLVLAVTAYIAYYYVVYAGFFTVVYLAAWVDWVAITRARGPQTRIARRLRALCLVGAIVSGAIALAIVLTGGRSFEAGPIRVTATMPQNALTAMWVFVVGWIACVWRPTLTLDSASRARMRRATAVVWRLAAVFLAGAAPLLWQAAGLLVRGEYVTPEYGWRSVPHGVDLLAPLVGHPLHPLMSAASVRAYAALGENYVEVIGWIGIVPAVLLIVTRGTLRHAGARQEMRVWRVVAIAFAIFALGPFLTIGGFDTGLKLPEILVRYVPFAANARMPGRAMVGVYMSLAVLIATQLGAATGRLRSPAMQWLLIGLVTFEYWDSPIRLTPLDHPPVYRALAAAGPGAVCEVPFGIGDGLSTGVGSQERRVMFYATLHEHPLVGGYIGRMPADAAERYSRNPLTATLLRLSGGTAAPSAGLNADPSPCRYLVVDRASSSAALQSYVAQLPADRIATDERRDLYRLR